MKKQFLFLFLATVVATTVHSQGRGTRVGYIDMEYILQNVPNYTEATNQLEVKVQKWKQEVEAKKLEIEKIKEALKAEKALLTKNLIEEREAEIKFLETQMLDYQQKRFGVNGDLMIQKSILAKPIQDQVFTAVQDIAEAKNYDFILDKSSDLTLLFADKRYDISDQVLRVINRTDKREQLTKKQLADQEAKDQKEDRIQDNPLLVEREKALEAKKAARDKAIEDRRALQAQKKKEYEDKIQKILDEREAKKNGTISDNIKKEEDSTKAAEPTATEKEAAKAKTIEDRQKLIDERKKAFEDRKAKIIQQRDSIKKARELKINPKQ
jgi:Skp family chaperone for outer membrane proteins